MTKTVCATSKSGFNSEVSIRDFSLSVDATGSDSPDTLETTLAAYAACYIPALRVAADQHEIGELGEIELTADGETDEDGFLSIITFVVDVEKTLSDEERDQLIAKADELCKVHDALKQSLHATIEIA
ncbi:OsmC family protein [Salinarchaeum sp. IM2453]|uniref:OsmC family protein n=1 Tax=Salinarchaeum sp. IM2453 TaxID=2862870 RepID=UPI001C83F8BF|nr:OsmC family protein [Salinarchaeum sp. IM2453]QZA88320.1 OsmC family protein [Salinarchaeum sp. IM2453]